MPEPKNVCRNITMMVKLPILPNRMPGSFPQSNCKFVTLDGVCAPGLCADLFSPTHFAIYSSEPIIDRPRSLLKVVVSIVGTLGSDVPHHWTHTENTTWGQQVLERIASVRELPLNIVGKLSIGGSSMHENAREIGNFVFSAPLCDQTKWSFFDHFPLANAVSPPYGLGLGSLFEVAAIEALLDRADLEIKTIEGSSSDSTSRKKQLTSAGICIGYLYPVDLWLNAHKENIRARQKI